MLLEDKLGIPSSVAHLLDAIFESLPAGKARDFSIAVPAAIPLGSDPSMVTPHFLYWMLTDDVKPTCYPQFQEFIDAVVALYEEWTRTGVRPDESTYLAALAYLAYLAYRKDLEDRDRADRAYRADLAAEKLLSLLAAAPMESEVNHG